jgi:hypothetical protein
VVKARVAVDVTLLLLCCLTMVRSGRMRDDLEAMAMLVWRRESAAQGVMGMATMGCGDTLYNPVGMHVLCYRRWVS